MTKEKAKTEKKEIKTSCADKACPIHGENKLKLRGRIFQGTVVRKLHGRVAIEFDRISYIPKYERYEKRKTRLHARLPSCLNNIGVGDLIKIAECRPLSKIIHFIAIEKIKSAEENK
jgi:small subunit ribosomal protein S17